MEKLDKVIRALELHRSCGSQDSPCPECPYGEYEMYCMSVLERDCLEVLRYQNIRIKELKDSRLTMAAVNRKLEEKLQQVEAERDDLRKDIAVLTEDLTGAHMDEKLEIRTAYCPICDKHFRVRSNDSSGSCPDCGHHVVLHRLEESDDV